MYICVLHVSICMYRWIQMMLVLAATLVRGLLAQREEVLYICKCICIYVCMYIYTHTYIYVYTYIYI